MNKFPLIFFFVELIGFAYFFAQYFLYSHFLVLLKIELNTRHFNETIIFQSLKHAESAQMLTKWKKIGKKIHEKQT